MPLEGRLECTGQRWMVKVSLASQRKCSQVFPNVENCPEFLPVIEMAFQILEVNSLCAQSTLGSVQPRATSHTDTSRMHEHSFA